MVTKTWIPKTALKTVLPYSEGKNAIFFRNVLLAKQNMIGYPKGPSK